MLEQPSSLVVSNDHSNDSHSAAIALLLLTLTVYGLFSVYAAFYGRTWTDEVTYLAKSWWYVNGVAQPYSSEDATWYMPLYFYTLGYAQKLFGSGYVVGRMLSGVLGGLSGIFLFLVCRKLNLSALVSAIAVLIYLLTPTTAYYFSTATPLAAVAFLHLVVIWLLVHGIQKPTPSTTIFLGVLFCTLFFIRQNMILAVGVLGPLYIYAIKQKRLLHTCLLLGAASIPAVLLFALFPEKLWHYTIRLPVVTPLLADFDVLADNLVIIQQMTETPLSLGFNFSTFNWQDPVYAFLLPYGGTILAATASLFLSSWPLQLRLLIGGYFFFLAATHYFGSAGYCRSCILTYTNYFIGIGVVAAAGALSVLWQKTTKTRIQAVSVIVVAGMGVLLLNISLSGLSSETNRYRLYPEPMLRKTRPLTEMSEAELFSSIIAEHTTADRPVLVLSNQPALTYAVLRAGLVMPPQSLNPRQSYRQIKAGVSDSLYTDTVHALEDESLWTDATLIRWINQEYDEVIYVEKFGGSRPNIEAALDDQFDLKSRINWRGWNVRFYHRSTLESRSTPAPSDDKADEKTLARKMICELEFVRMGFQEPCLVEAEHRR